MANIPSIPSDASPALRQFLTWVLGVIGRKGLNKQVTFSDLIAMGVVSSEKASKRSSK